MRLLLQSMLCLLGSTLGLLLQMPDLWGQAPGAPLSARSLAPLRPAAAVVGEPFGVLVVEVPLPPHVTVPAIDDVRVLITEKSDRVFYPATLVRTIEVKEPEPSQLPGRFRPGGLIDRIRGAIRIDKTRRVPVAVTICALFGGHEPLELQLLGDVNQTVIIKPSLGPPGSLSGGPNAAALAGGIQPTHANLLQEWWAAFATRVEHVKRTGDHPQLLHSYLASMLAHRLHLPWPLPSPDPDDRSSPKPKKVAEPLGTLALLSGIEPLRDEIFDQLLNQPVSDAEATLPLPPAAAWQQTLLPPPPPDATVESMASRVPPECFYLRFGSFANYLWFQDLSANNGGDLAQIILVRGFNYETSRRMERMLNTRMTAIAKMFGDQVISDMAIIGRDLYMKEGASLGVLFASPNKSLLLTSLNSERKQAIGKVPGATLQTVQIEGKDVSLLSTPDNSIRSFLVEDGQHVLLTSSQELARRFLQVSGGQPSLASLDSFRWARQWMPEANSYSVFAYFSPEFFHGLVEPAYQVELRRRLEAIAHIELAEVAARAAAAEGITPTVPEMIAAGLLPEWFDRRADGARTLRMDDRWIDSLRGARGSFLPIVDVAVDRVSPAEAERIEKLTGYYQSQWQQMDPMLVGLRRFQAEGDTNSERVSIEAYIAPFGKEKYGWVGDLLAPAAPVAIRIPSDDIVSVQLLMNGTAPLTAPRQPYHLFAGVKDMVPPAPGDTKGLIKTLRALKTVPGYLGAFPLPGYLDQLPLGLGGGRPDAFGYSRSIIGLYRWQDAGFSVLSFDKSILDSLRGILLPMRTEDSAQVRLRIATLEGSQLSGWINDQWYERAARASHGNAALLDAIGQQLKVPGPQSLTVAQQMLDVKLNCPLGGSFAFVPAQQVAGQLPGAQSSTVSNVDAIGWWSSSAWASERVGGDGTLAPPPDYVAPWLRWFRGAQLHLTQFPDRLAVVGTFDTQRQTPSPQADEAPGRDALPPLNFDLFQLPFKMFGGGQKEAENTPQKRKF